MGVGREGSGAVPRALSFSLSLSLSLSIYIDMVARQAEREDAGRGMPAGDTCNHLVFVCVCVGGGLYAISLSPRSLRLELRPST